MAKTKSKHVSDFLPTQEGLIAYVMHFDGKTREEAIALNRRAIKNFDQLPKGKVVEHA